MDRQKRDLIVLSAAVLVAVVLWVRGLSAPVGRKQNAERALATIQPDSALIQPPDAASKGRARTNFPEWGRNPFTLSEDRIADVRGLVLEGIVWEEATPLVVINDKVLGVGDAIGKIRITKITQTEVFLEEEGSKFILRVGKGPD